MSGDDRVEKKIDAGKRGDMSDRGAGRLETVTSGGTANTAVNAGGETSERAGEKERRERSLLFGDGIEVGG